MTKQWRCISLLLGLHLYFAWAEKIITILDFKHRIGYIEFMGGGEDIIESFAAQPSEKLIGVFEYMMPSFWEDHQYIVFVSKDGDDCFLYQYYKNEDAELPEIKEELEKLYAAFDFFKSQGIPLDECSVHSIYEPYYSRVLYPPEDLGKKVYLTDGSVNPPEPVTLWGKIKHWLTCREPSSVRLDWNKELFLAPTMERVTIKRWQTQPIPLFE